MDSIISLKRAVFESPRLSYRGIAKEDAEMIVLWRSNEHIYRFFYNPQPITMEAQLDWFENYLGDETRLDFIISEKETGQKLGIVGLQNIKHSTADISYMIGEEKAQGNGFGSEAITAISAFAFERLNIDSLNAVIHMKNIASQKAARKAGYHPDFITYVLKRETR